MITKEQLLKSIADMPEQINIDVLLDKVLLLQKIEAGLAQSEKRQVISTEELKKEVSKWSK